MPARRLQPVPAAGPDTKTPRKTTTRRSVAKAADEGTQLELLLVLRNRLAKAIDDKATPPRDLSSLSRRLMEVSREIQALERQEAEDADQTDHGDDAFDPSTV